MFVVPCDISNDFDAFLYALVQLDQVGRLLAGANGNGHHYKERDAICYPQSLKA